ncbi:MAG: PP0621 family protein [Pseudomonadota bacterium]
MGRLFFIIAIFLLGWLAFRYFRTQLMLREQQQKHIEQNPTTIADVKPCAFCGTHMPEEEMLTKGKLHFCSYQHMLDFDEKNK